MRRTRSLSLGIGLSAADLVCSGAFSEHLKKGAIPAKNCFGSPGASNPFFWKFVLNPVTLPLEARVRGGTVPHGGIWRGRNG
jgi:hypothetical protein